MYMTNFRNFSKNFEVAKHCNTVIEYKVEK